jgi:protein HOOK3
MYSDKSNERMIKVMQSMGTKFALPIAAAIEEMEELDLRLAEMAAETEPGSDVDHSTDSEAPGGTSYERDPELEREEKLIQALQENRKLENKLAELAEDLKESQEKCATLQEELEESKYSLDKRRRTTMEESSFQQLNIQASRDKDYIAELEADLANATTTIEGQERQIERFKSDAESKQELRDELQLIKSERDELRQKTKANENLKKKIQTLQEHERANASLRRELQNAQEQLQDVDALRDRCSALEKANEENAQTIANGEQEIFDQKTAKQRMAHELKVLEQRYEQTHNMLVAAQETIRDLEDRNQDLQSSHSDGGDGLSSLDAELAAESGVSDETEKRQLARKSTVPVGGADTIVLQQNLSIANASVARLEQRCLDLLQENLGFKSDIDSADDPNSSHPFQHQVRRLESITKELEEAQSKYIASTSEITDLKRRLEYAESQGKSLPSSRSKLSGTETSRPKANAEKLGESDVALAQNHERQAYVEELQTQLREHRSLLRHALLSTDALQKEAEEIRRSNEYKLVLHQLELVRSASNEEAEEVAVGAATSLTDRIESGRIAVAERGLVSHARLNVAPLTPLLQQLAEHKTQISMLQTQISSLKALPPPPSTADKDIAEELANVHRENKLIASAWYDLTCRLQSNTVMLARRQEAPKSWLGRQRGVVAGAGAKRVGS